MKATSLSIPEVILFEPRVFGDARGFFFESFNRRVFENAIGRTVEFVQDNHSRSVKGVLRGLHYQIQNVQGKLVRVVEGEVLTSRLTCVALPTPLDIGLGHICRRKTNVSCGFQRGSPTDLLYCLILLNFFIRLQIIIRQPTSVAWRGMMQQSRFSGL